MSATYRCEVLADLVVRQSAAIAMLMTAIETNTAHSITDEAWCAANDVGGASCAAAALPPMTTVFPGL